MFQVQYRNDHGDWVRRDFYRSRKLADAAAEKISESGYTARIIKDGKIIKYFERAAK